MNWLEVAGFVFFMLTSVATGMAAALVAAWLVWQAIRWAANVYDRAYYSGQLDRFMLPRRRC